MKFVRTARSWGVVLLFAVCLLPAGGCFIFNYSNLLLGLGNFSVYAEAPDDASAIEVDLESDGPVDLPVTIAKLDAPDAGKIVVEAESAGFSESAPWLSSPVPLGQSGGRVMVITGGSGAVDVTETPALIAYVLRDSGVDVASAKAFEAGEDGSFVIRIAADVSEEVIFAGATADLQYSSSFLRVIQQVVEEDGARRENFVIVTTNSSSIAAGQGVMSDSSGYYYLGLNRDDGGRGFVRKNLDGTEGQVLIEELDEPLDHVTALSEYKVATIDAAGTLSLIIPSSAGLGLTMPGAMYDEIASYSRTYLTLSPYEAENTRLFITADEDGLLVNQSSEDYVALTFVRTVSGAAVPIIQEGWFDDAKIALSPGDDQIYAFVLYEGAYLFYQVDLTGSAVTAWSQKTLLSDDLDFTEVHSVDAAGGTVVVDATDSAGSRALYYWTVSTGFVQATDPDSDAAVYANAKMSPDGAFLIACRLGATADEPNQFVYHRPFSDDFGTAHLVTNSAGEGVCGENPATTHIGQDNVLYFYRTELATGLPQMALLNLDYLE